MLTAITHTFSWFLAWGMVCQYHMTIQRHQILFSHPFERLRHFLLCCRQRRPEVPVFNRNGEMLLKHYLHLGPRDPVCIKTGFNHEIAFPYSFRKSKVIQRILEMVSKIDLMRADSLWFKDTLHLHNKREKFFQANMLKHR